MKIKTNIKPIIINNYLNDNFSPKIKQKTVKQIKINDIINNFNNSSKINPINIDSEIKIKFTSFTFF